MVKNRPKIYDNFPTFPKMPRNKTHFKYYFLEKLSRIFLKNNVLIFCGSLHFLEMMENYRKFWDDFSP